MSGFRHRNRRHFTDSIVPLDTGSYAVVDQLPHTIPELPVFPIWLVKYQRSATGMYYHAVTRLETDVIAAVMTADGVSRWQINLLIMNKDQHNPNSIKNYRKHAGWNSNGPEEWQQRWDLIHRRPLEVLTEMVF